MKVQLTLKAVKSALAEVKRPLSSTEIREAVLNVLTHCKAHPSQYTVTSRSVEAIQRFVAEV